MTLESIRMTLWQQRHVRDYYYFPFFFSIFLNFFLLMDPAVAKTPSRPQQSSTYLAQGHIMTNRTVAETFLSYNL